jgi:hypothetical protein
MTTEPFFAIKALAMKLACAWAVFAPTERSVSFLIRFWGRPCFFSNQISNRLATAADLDDFIENLAPLIDQTPRCFQQRQVSRDASSG